MKKMIMMCIIFSSSIFAGEENFYANLYADQLIKEFDKSLDNAILYKNLIENPIYAKIQAAREYIEHNGGASKYNKYSLLKILDSEKYNEIVDVIDKNSLTILQKHLKIKNREEANGLLYPSTTRAGNVTGNTFPKKVWSLTFDDGPRSKRTETIVDNLEKHNMKASFFMLMSQAKVNTRSVDYVVANDMEVALHSYNHKDLNKASAATMDYEIGSALTELEALSNQDINLFRLPYGSGLRNKLLRKKIADNKLIHIFWNVDTLDWKDKNPKTIYERTLKQMKASPKNSGIILFHDIHAQTVIASELVMKYLNDSRKTVCTVGETIKFINGIHQNCI